AGRSAPVGSWCGETYPRPGGVASRKEERLHAPQSEEEGIHRRGSTHPGGKKKEFTAGAPLIPEGRRRSSPQGLHSPRREEEGIHRRGRRGRREERRRAHRGGRGGESLGMMIDLRLCPRTRSRPYPF